jgi:uncharacterized protein (TIGR03000 family)
MYSLVLMSALTAGTNAPDCCWCYPAYYPVYSWYPAAYPVYYPYPAYYPAYYSYYYPGWGWYPNYGYACAPAQVILDSSKDAKKAKKQKLPKDLPEPKKEPERERKKDLETSALLTVILPADARLYVDGRLMKSVTEKRSIITPPLTPGQKYYYQVKAEVDRNGQTVSETVNVLLKPGEETETSFADLERRAAALAKIAGP